MTQAPGNRGRTVTGADEPDCQRGPGSYGCIIGDTRGYTRVIPFGRMSSTPFPVPGCSILEYAMRHPQRHQPRTPRVSPSVLERINPNAAGIDCGAAEHYVAVPPDRDPNPVQSFKTFTSDLVRLAEWLKTCGITSVAMEATGVYWIPLYEILEARGFAVRLVNARHVKNVPGRKSDVSDCEWLRELNIVGLLRGSFRPSDAIVALRAYLRHRQTLLETAGMHIQRMQKALVQMNLQLPVVVSDITGVTGLRILRALIAGPPDPHRLAQLRDHRCHASEAEIVAALTGNYRPEHLFVLQQNLELFDFCQLQLAACDRAIEAHVQTLIAPLGAPATALPPPRVTRTPRARDNAPRFEIRTSMHHLTGGVDLTQIDGIAPYTALKLLSEIGTDMSRWPTEKHFTSWLTLAPKNKISGGRLLSSRTQPSANRAAGILRMTAMSLGRTQTMLGAFYRRLAARIGKPQAITATARKLAILVYRALKGELDYRDVGADGYDAQQRARTLRQLRRRAANLGFELLNPQTGEILTAALSHGS
jgi:transposase